MNITEAYIRETFKKLPKGYYLGRDINVELSATTNMTYFSPIEDKIVVSLPMIMSALQKDISSGIEVEKLVRGLLYHEISHVILTPAYDIVENAVSYYTINMDIFNIFEDERIETIFKDYYMRVNFKKNLYRLNDGLVPVEGTYNQKCMAKFYNLVRFRTCEGHPELLEEVKKIIEQNLGIDALSNYIGDYISAINDLYRKVMDLVEKEEKSENSKNNSTNDSTNSENSDSSENNEGSEGSECDFNLEFDNETSNSSEDTEENPYCDKDKNEKTKMDAPTPDNDSSEEESNSSEEENNSLEDKEDKEEKGDSDSTDEDLTNPMDDIIKDISDTLSKNEFELSEMIKDAANRVLNAYQNPDIQNKLGQILRKVKTKDGMRNPSTITYQGRINPRLVGNRTDYKWSTKRSGNSHLKGKQKLHLTLWVDNSGSFRKNDFTMNQFITALENCANKDFEYDVLTINSCVNVLEKGKLFKSRGCNKTLFSEINPLYKKYQKVQYTNYNVVLFDGDCHSNDFIDYYGKSYANENDGLRCFNHNNCIIVSDKSNRKAIDICAPQARKVYTANYAEDFIDEVFNLLERSL